LLFCAIAWGHPSDRCSSDLAAVAEIPLFPESRRLAAEHHPALDREFSAMRPGCSQYCVASLAAWNQSDEFRLSRLDNVILIGKRGPEGKTIFLSPVGGDLTDRVSAVRSVLRQHPEAVFEQVEHPLAVALGGGELNVESTRDLHEYVYRTDDLVNLQRHKDLRYKRKGIDGFAAQFPGAVAVPLGGGSEPSPELERKVERFLERWATFRADSASEKERQELAAARELLKHRRELGLTGVAEVVDGEVAAFALGRPISPDTFTVLVEKADPASFPGAYQVINQRMAEQVQKAGYPFINRMDDWGVPGLRQAKKSYQPSHMVEVYRVSGQAQPKE
jgi:hypothetical protein